MGRILVVDPSLLDRKRMTILLEAAGHQVLEAASPSEFWSGRVVEPGESVDLILTELDMGDGPDPAFLVELKESPRWSAVPVVVVTAPLPRAAVIQLVKNGAETVVTKPFAPEVLLRRVTDVLLEYGDGYPEGAARWDLAAEVTRELKRSQRLATPVSVLVLRLDRPVDRRNRSLLFPCMGRVLRGSDRVAQVGPDAVGVLLTDADQAGAAEAVKRLASVIQREGSPVPFRLLGVGISSYPEDVGDGPNLIRLAQERAMNRLNP